MGIVLKNILDAGSVVGAMNVINDAITSFAQKINVSPIAIFIVGAVVGIVMLCKGCNEHSGLSQDGLIGIAVAVFCCLLFFLWSLPAYRDITNRIEKLTAEIRRKKDEAWAQVQPLLNLFTWDMPAELTQETYPE